MLLLEGNCDCNATEQSTGWDRIELRNKQRCYIQLAQPLCLLEGNCNCSARQQSKSWGAT